jgi:hypothetical protein
MANMTDPTRPASSEEEPARAIEPEPDTAQSAEDPGYLTDTAQSAEDPGYLTDTAQSAEDPGYLTETGQAVGDDGSVAPIIGGLPAVEGSAWDIGAPLDERGAGLADELGERPDQAGQADTHG